MPMLYVYVCPQCGTKSEESVTAPAGWFSVMVPPTPTETEELPARTEYFDTWNCVALYSAAQGEAEN